MSTIYLVANKGRLGKKGQTLSLQMDEKTTKVIFPYRTEQLVLIGNIDISTPALKMLMHHRINTVFVNKNGKFNGKLIFNKGKNVFLRQKQFKLIEDPDFVLAMAKSIAAGKIHNQFVFMQRIRRERHVAEVSEQVERVKDILDRLPYAESVDTVRGLEGAAARAYFSTFKYAIVPDWAHFPGRSMNPPKSNVNAVLSFLYTLILNRVEAALETIGLDPYVGFLHAMEYGKTSLAFDMMEEFRVPLSDTLTVSMFNLGVLNESDFREVNFSPEDDEFPLDAELPSEEEKATANKTHGILLTQEGLRKVIPQFEKKLESKIMHALSDKRLNYKQIIFAQASHLKRVIQGEERTYKPFLVR